MPARRYNWPIVVVVVALLLALCALSDAPLTDREKGRHHILMAFRRVSDDMDEQQIAGMLGVPTRVHAEDERTLWEYRNYDPEADRFPPGFIEVEVVFDKTRRVCGASKHDDDGVESWYSIHCDFGLSSLSNTR